MCIKFLDTFDPELDEMFNEIHLVGMLFSFWFEIDLHSYIDVAKVAGEFFKKASLREFYLRDHMASRSEYETRFVFPAMVGTVLLNFELQYCLNQICLTILNIELVQEAFVYKVLGDYFASARYGQYRSNRFSGFDLLQDINMTKIDCFM